MSIFKQAKDRIIKAWLGKDAVPAGLFEYYRYNKNNGSINFKFEQKDGMIVAISTNFRWGSIVTAGKDRLELDKNIKDAILTSFEIPFSYAKEANVHALGIESKEYAPA